MGDHHCCAPSLRGDESPAFRRVLWMALWINAAMFFVEIVGSYAGDSVSLQADALDFFGDAANYAISLFVVGSVLTVRARASLIKGVSMALFGIFVLGSALERAINGSEPVAMTMGAIGLLALLANVIVAASLFRYRQGDSNMQSIWLCSRNDVIGNLAVVVAAAGVFTSATRWPDLIVASIIATLSLSSAWQVIRLANSEIQQAHS